MSAWTEIGDRVFVRRYAFYNQNIGAVLGDGAALVVDTRSTHGQAREIVGDLRSLTSDPVAVVVDTHGHFDHAFGNRVFRPAIIWGHAGCPAFMARTGERARSTMIAEYPHLAADLAEVVIDPPEHLFTEQATVEIGGRQVELRFLGRAHTDHDIVVSVPGADVVFAGDLIEGGAVPFFGDGYPLEWPATAEALAGMVTGTVVPGHGNRGGRSFALEQARAFGQLVELARSVHAGSLTLDDALALTPFPEYPAEGIREPLERALAQLRGELD
jgi:glyoxylase-like metal-dependent hydrolase (beta-lactamase superfamily II)